MVHFVGAGSGAPDLITLRGARLLGEADVVIYAGSLVNPELLTLTKPGCEVRDSAKLTLEEVIALIERAERERKTTVRLHTGDPSIYGAVREQFDALTERGIDFDVCPGVSSFCGAFARCWRRRKPSATRYRDWKKRAFCRLRRTSTASAFRRWMRSSSSQAATRPFPPC